MRKAPKNQRERTRHPTLWTVEAVQWEFREHRTEYQRVLARKGERGPGVQLGEPINTVEVPDRPFAIAVAHHLLDRHAEEAAGRMSLEVHIHPPEQDRGDESVYKVIEEVLEQARQLGIEGDVEQQVKVMARDATPFKNHLRHGRYALRIEGNTVTSIGLADPPKRLNKACRYRNGLLITMLICAPIRLKNLAGLVIGRHLICDGQDYRIELTAGETKTGRPYVADLPTELSPYIDGWLNTHRLNLQLTASGKVEGGGPCWIDCRGKPMSGRTIQRVFAWWTERACDLQVRSLTSGVGQDPTRGLRRRDPRNVAPAPATCTT